MKKMSTKMLVTAGILIALNIVLSRFLSINLWNMKFGFTFVSLFVAGYFYGPGFAAIVAGIADVIGALLFPSAAFFPGFTISAILEGAVFGLFLHKKQTKFRILCAVLLNQLVVSLLITTLWISILHGAPYEGLLMTRIVQCLIMIPVQFITISVMTRMLARTRREVLQK